MTSGESNFIIVGDFRFLNTHKVQIVGLAFSTELFCLPRTFHVPRENRVSLRFFVVFFGDTIV